MKKATTNLYRYGRRGYSIAQMRAMGYQKRAKEEAARRAEIIARDGDLRQFNTSLYKSTRGYLAACAAGRPLRPAYAAFASYGWRRYTRKDLRALSFMYRYIKAGGVIYFERGYGRAIWYSYDAARRLSYCGWRHFGSSAISLKWRDFMWLFSVIFSEKGAYDLLCDACRVAVDEMGALSINFIASAKKYMEEAGYLYE